jgi:hypothetical protein
MSRSTPLYVLVGLLIIVGAFVRLDVEHADITSFITFISGAIIPGIAAIAGIKAHNKASEANDTAQVAVDKADTAATAATKAESNTNGKMDARFTQVRTDIAGLVGKVNVVDSKLSQHLADHEGGA